MKRHDRLAWVKVTALALMLAAACGRGDGGPGPAAYDPCAGKACGAACTTCDPLDKTCAEAAVLKYCDSQGRCLPPFPVCPSAECKVDGDCPQIQSCAVCPDGSAACPEARCVDGQCITRFPPCPSSDCETSEDCPQLGMPCQVCSNGSVACPGSDCVGGKCVVTYPRCDAYDPCQGKACGASCTVCNPQDPACVETGVLKFCDAAGECRPSNPVCVPPGQCTTTADCPGVGACPRCPGDQCAELECVAGQCVFTCPPAPPPECTSNDDCPALGMRCVPCPDGWSACPSVACESGACVTHFPTCHGHDPCSGKTCGDSCDLCGGACASPVATYCNAAGQCTMGVPACNDICRLPADPGPCLAYMPRFHFDETTGKCTRFVYGGCAGNENNFDTAEACVSACAPTVARPCDVIACDADTQCLYVQGAVPVCASPCLAGDVCPAGLVCGCGASCPDCENCLRACIPVP